VLNLAIFLSFFMFWFPSTVSEFLAVFGYWIFWHVLELSSFDFHQLLLEIWQVFGCWIWHVFDLQVLISINCLRIFGSFGVLNLACFWASSSFDFHQLSHNIWQFWGVEFGMFSSFSFDFQQLLQNLASSWEVEFAIFKKLQFWFQTIVTAWKKFPFS
jgi:hypothetical protein